MISVIVKNRWYFFGFAACMVTGLALVVNFPKGYFVLLSNNGRHTLLDQFFPIITRLGEAYTFVVVIIGLCFYKLRYAFMLLTTSLSVLVISQVLKKAFAHLRPFSYFETICRHTDLQPIDGVPFLGGDTSFPSGHTMGGFALFTTIALISQHKKWLAVVLLFMATLVGISRIYLMHHFLEDVLLGAFIGLLIAYLVYILFMYRQVFGLPVKRHWLDQPLWSPPSAPHHRT